MGYMCVKNAWGVSEGYGYVWGAVISVPTIFYSKYCLYEIKLYICIVFENKYVQDTIDIRLLAIA